MQFLRKCFSLLFLLAFFYSRGVMGTILRLPQTRRTQIASRINSSRVPQVRVIGLRKG
jgi:hypothetical protein